jgi:hypothetical protein
LKLPDNETKEALLDPRQLSNYFTRPAILWAFCYTNRQFQFNKRAELFVGIHNELINPMEE